MITDLGYGTYVSASVNIGRTMLTLLDVLCLPDDLNGVRFGIS
jgi:hypothetical protein